MTKNSTAALPQNVQSAIAKFSQAKATYLELQERLGQIAKRLEKHQKSAEANQAQAEQLSIQWRDAFRQNDGEITKEIRTAKNSEQEARDFAEECNNLVAVLTPEFNSCQVDTFRARKKHQESFNDLQDLYADYRLNKASDELFSLPQAKSFFSCLAYKLKGISDYVHTTEPYNRILLDEEVNKTQRLMNEKFINDIFQKHLKAVGGNYFSNLEIADCTLAKPIENELTNISPARLATISVVANANLAS